MNAITNPSKAPAHAAAAASARLDGSSIARPSRRATVRQPSGWSRTASGEAAPAVHGRSRSPGRSRSSSGTASSAPSTTASAAAASPTPPDASSRPVPMAAPATPRTAPPHISALARGCSSSGTTSTAMPSTAVSSTATEALTSTPAAVSQPRCVTASGTSDMTAKPVTTPSPPASTQGRRRPIGRNEKRSMTGPTSALSANGSRTAPR